MKLLLKLSFVGLIIITTVNVYAQKEPARLIKTNSGYQLKKNGKLFDVNTTDTVGTGLQLKLSYAKVEKCDDPEILYYKAKEYFSKKQYSRAVPILEKLIGYVKATGRAEEVYMMYADAQYLQKNYIIAAYHYKRFTEVFPNNAQCETALYRNAECYFKQSPRIPLEQTNTQKAIEAYQYFINSYPESKKVSDANKAIDDLRRKLELKSLSIANLYYKTENYRAATISIHETLNQFPDIDEAEDLSFTAVKSISKFAENSVIEKKAERYVDVVNECMDFEQHYKNSPKLEQVNKIKEEAISEMLPSALRAAEVSPLDDRMKKLEDVVLMEKRYNDWLTNADNKKNTEQILEQVAFLKVKTNYAKAIGAKKELKEKSYNEAIKSYYNFIDKYQSSKFAHEAERMFEASTNYLKKLKQNG